MLAGRRSLFGLVLLVLAVTAASQWWHGRYEQRLGARLATLAAPGDIRMLSSDTCVYCSVARRWFSEHRVAFSECSIERDAVCAADYQARLAPGTPLLLVRGQTQVGFNPERVLAALQRAG